MGRWPGRVSRRECGEGVGRGRRNIVRRRRQRRGVGRGDGRGRWLRGDRGGFVVVHRGSREPGGEKIAPASADKFVHTKGVNRYKTKKTGQIRPVYRSSHVRGSPPDSMVRQGCASYGGTAARVYGCKWFRWIWLRGRK